MSKKTIQEIEKPSALHANAKKTKQKKTKTKAIKQKYIRHNLSAESSSTVFT